MAALDLDGALAEVARRAALLVPADAVQPLRAVVASMIDFPDLVRAYAKATGTPADRAAAALLAVIQPGLAP